MLVLLLVPWGLDFVFYCGAAAPNILPQHASSRKACLVLGQWNRAAACGVKPVVASVNMCSCTRARIQL